MIALVFSVDVLGLLHDAAHLYTTGMEHSPTSATATGWERTPWHAVQGAAGLSGIACAVAQPGIRKFLIRGARDRHVRAP
jgi:hypothetical protein